MREKVKKGERTTVAVAKETKDALDSIKHPGQSYDGAIRELLQLYKAEQKGRHEEF